ncbi:TonB-dependent receptor plug domain-containing protein [Candidatus Manganitrophus noduliformans]|uniref:TonB-dependent receptor n=1 Tax=Candidatus Manganitrophus noduliformans TaxID=2606439 RepID=A0A7X6DUR3_9BACT|nr:TonB-dependent receptor [Candidatus Manganitrophus noduliformans]NKE73534.1 TonB-dependent receptor [Candidatus Manganitrophus noduliformans]
MGGVINVITREPKESFSFTLEMDAGNYGSKNLGDAELGGRLGAAHTLADLSLKRPRWNPKLTSDLRRSEGFDLDKLNRRSIQTDGDEGLRWNLDPLFALTPPGGGKILLSPRYYKEDKEHLFSTNVPGLGQSPGKFAEEVGKWHITLGGKMPLEEGSRLSGTVAYEQLLDISSSSQDIPCLPQLDQKRTAVIELSKGEVQWHIPMRERHLFMAGAVAGRETLTQEQVSNEASGVIKVQEMTPGAGRRNYEAYLQDDIFLASRLELLPGIRYQVDSDFGLFVAPRINLMAKAASSVNLRLGYGKRYRVPNLRERFSSLTTAPSVIRCSEIPISRRSLPAASRPGLRHENVATGLQIFEFRNVNLAVTQGGGGVGLSLLPAPIYLQSRLYLPLGERHRPRQMAPPASPAPDQGGPRYREAAS